MISGHGDSDQFVDNEFANLGSSHDDNSDDEHGSGCDESVNLGGGCDESDDLSSSHGDGCDEFVDLGWIHGSGCDEYVSLGGGGGDL